MKGLYQKLSIKQKFFLLFSIQIIIPLVFMGMMLYRTSTDIIQNKSIDYSVDLLKMVELRFDDFSDNVQVTAQDILYDPIVYDVLEGDRTDTSQLDDLYNLLRKVCLSRNEINGVSILISEEEHFSYNTTSGRAITEVGFDYQTILQEASNVSGQLSWYVDQSDSGHVRQIYVLRTINNIDRYEELGVMVIQLNLDELASVYGNLSTEFMEQIAIVTQDGDYVIGTGEPSQRQLSYLNELDETSVSNYWIDEEQNDLVCYRDLVHPSWRIITEISLPKLNEDMNEFRNYFLVIIAATILILSLLSSFMAVDIIDPINRLVDAMKHMKKDKVHDVVVVDRKDELGYLSESFNDMSGEIDFLVNQVYKEQLTRKEAELKTLQAQINPHFLFNTLESINWLARMNEVPEISSMVTALSSLMEAGIGKGGAMVSLREELEFADSYIRIMKGRYGDKLNYQNQVDRSVLAKRVPKLMLQPILENAIYHGIEKSRKEGTVSLLVEKSVDNIVIHITDNGKGMPVERLAQLNDLLSRTDLLNEEEDISVGIGLINVNKRLKLFFGDQYGIRIESVEGQHTTVIIHIPIKEDDKGGSNV